jgi:ABC-2 type transport system ATP-binding protein
MACDRSLGLLDPTFDGRALPQFASRLGDRIPWCTERVVAVAMLDTVLARSQQRYGAKTASRVVGLSSRHHDSRGYPLGMPVSVPALTIDRVTHRYGNAVALSELSFDVPANRIFGLLGPNGSGKSTLFRLISTLVPVQSGSIQLLGMDVMAERNRVRESLGVVFQSPSLDRKLTVRENMECQAALYGISGQKRADRIEALAKLMGISDRLNERCERLSGGLKRRAELAKGLLHQPRVLILDEPSTGLDPTARLDLWRALVELRDRWETSVLLTTHLLEEADKCDCLAILDNGKLVALDSPDNLRRATGETVISVMTDEPELVAGVLKSRFGWDPKTLDHQVRVVIDDPGIAIADILQTLAGNSLSITIGRPGLEDVFIRKTGIPFSSYQSDGRSIERK